MYMHGDSPKVERKKTTKKKERKEKKKQHMPCVFCLPQARP
jgi:hypothetical protein